MSRRFSSEPNPDGKSNASRVVSEARALGRIQGFERMAVKLDEIRSAAERVAASHGLDVVDLEFAGPAKERTLRVFLEKDAEGRARLKAEIASGAEGLAGTVG